MASCKHKFVKIHKNPFKTVFHCLACHEEFDELPKDKPEKKKTEDVKEAEPNV